MAVEINVVYTGTLGCAATHGPSGQQLTTDAPVDNGGRGSTFSPTDLVATALGACMLTIMGLMAERRGLDLRGTQVHVIKEMVAAPVRRIGRLVVRITLPPDRPIDADDRTRLERAALLCPVKQSLHPDVAIPIEWVWPA